MRQDQVAALSAAAAAMHSVTLLLEQRALAEVAPYQEVVDLRVPPRCPLDVSSTDFHHACLISRAETATPGLARLPVGRELLASQFPGLHAYP